MRTNLPIRSFIAFLAAELDVHSLVPLLAQKATHLATAHLPFAGPMNDLTVWTLFYHMK